RAAARGSPGFHDANPVGGDNEAWTAKVVAAAPGSQVEPPGVGPQIRLSSHVVMPSTGGRSTHSISAGRSGSRINRSRTGRLLSRRPNRRYQRFPDHQAVAGS